MTKTRTRSSVLYFIGRVNLSKLNLDQFMTAKINSIID